MNLQRTLVIPVLLLTILSAGCGGASSGAQAQVSGVPISFDIAWSGRSRQVAAPSSALSVAVSIPNAVPDGSNFLLYIDRDANLAAHVDHYVSSVPFVVVPGPYRVTFTFLDKTIAQGGGDIVGVASDFVTIANDGTGIGTIATQTTITSVVATPTSVTQGSTTQMSFTATDALANVVAVTPGSASWSVQSGTGFISITSDGILSYKAPGVATASVTVDGVASSPVNVTSLSMITVTVNPKGQTIHSIDTLQFGANLTNDTANAGVNWAVTDSIGQLDLAGGSITNGGLYSPPGTAGTYYVTATSVTDPTKSDIASVIVVVP